MHSWPFSLKENGAAINPPLHSNREIALVHRPDQISAFLQMAMEVGQMEEVLIEAFCHQFHDPGPLSHCRHEIALSAHGGIKLNVVPALVLVLKESGIEENVCTG
jgi:hypothetical protein